MAEIDPKQVEILERGRGVTQVLGDDGKPLGIFRGPWLDKYYDSYTECLFKNIEAKRIADNLKQGLNEHGQTKEQELDFQRRKKLADEKKKRAEALLTASEMVK